MVLGHLTMSPGFLGELRWDLWERDTLAVAYNKIRNYESKLFVVSNDNTESMVVVGRNNADLRTRPNGETASFIDSHPRFLILLLSLSATSSIRRES